MKFCHGKHAKNAFRSNCMLLARISVFLKRSPSYVHSTSRKIEKPVATLLIIPFDTSTPMIQ